MPPRGHRPSGPPNSRTTTTTSSAQPATSRPVSCCPENPGRAAGRHSRGRPAATRSARSALRVCSVLK
ncbi:hypothetical protein EAO76_24085 [Streptomyces sp. sk2.1]|nr:hypothetical protein EAO76_24085 [Streptomyces sp. sk2.1]